jgi:hypothetical protein
MKRFWMSSIVAATLMAAGAGAAASADELRAGIYDLRTVPGTTLDGRKVYLAVDQGRVSGYFDNPFTTPAENDPDRDPTCRFLLEPARPQGGSIRFKTAFADEQGDPLQLTSTGHGDWKVRVGGILPNCGIPTIDTGDTLHLSTEKPWLAFASVTARRAPLYTAASDDARGKAYLVRNDVVAVLERVGPWVRVDYFARGADLIRWMKRADLRD